MNCHGDGDVRVEAGSGPVVLVGNPNVGKSALFAALTGRYVAVSNYPGTTVEIAQGSVRVNGHTRPAVDTPGVRSIVPFSDDEEVAREILLTDAGATVVQVADMKNLRRALLLTFELAESGVPFVLVLNMADEAEARGIAVDTRRLSELLGVPVVATVATRRRGVDQLAGLIPSARPAAFRPTFAEPIERAVAEVAELVPEAPLPARALALMLLAGDERLAERLELGDERHTEVERISHEAERRVGEPLAYAINRSRLAAADAIVGEVLRQSGGTRGAGERIGRWSAHPVVGWPILLGVLLLVYLLVGVLGAGTLVNLLETKLFGKVVNPWAVKTSKAIPWDLVREFLTGKYGLVTMALTYGLAIVLPIVATFFLAFGVLEDSGYLPRLAVMLDRGFRRIGLNGKAVLPMVLGLGCVTMATMTTRILETRRERIQVTLLLALSIPCSAQLGVILGMIGPTGAIGAAIWVAVVVTSLLAVGWLAAKVIPGQPSDFILELPPMRAPSVRNVVVKTGARMEWYLREVIPVFVIGTAALFALDKLGLLGGIEDALSPLVERWLGLPAITTGVLLIGFLRRDYGAAGLFALARAGLLTPSQTLVSLVVITLFVPCIASLLMIVKEHGAKTAAIVVTFVFVFAVLVGGLLNMGLEAFHVPIG